MNLEDAVRIFHESEDCPGLITSEFTGELKCSECGQVVGKLDSIVLRSIIELLEQVPAKN